jgi:NADH dehydrogenase FAD-containing subunit
VAITRVSGDNFFLFTHALHEVAASDLDITHIISPIRTLLKRDEMRTGNVSSLRRGAVPRRCSATSWRAAAAITRLLWRHR